MILVSVVIPIYNMEKSIVSSTECIINQTLKDIEIILVDDGSTDGTLEECNKIASKDSRVSVIHTLNQGAGLARNEGIIRASGKYVYFPDADDILEKDALEILVKIADKTDTELVVFGYKCVDRNKKILSERNYPNVNLKGENIRNKYFDYFSKGGKYQIQGAPWNKFFRLDVIKNNKLLFPDLRRHQDEAFIAKYIDVVKDVTFLDKQLYTYYANDLKKEWDKYPINYFEIARQLYEERKKNILIWNPDDVETHDLVYSEYIYNTIKAMELSFSTKYHFNYKQRIEWIQSKTEKSLLKDIKKPSNLHIYQKVILKLLLAGKWMLAYCAMKSKIFIEMYIR